MVYTLTGSPGEVLRVNVVCLVEVVNKTLILEYVSFIYMVVLIGLEGSSDNYVRN